MDKPHRQIRSFVRRTGRITPAQRQAIESLWPQYGVGKPTGLLDLDSLFGRSAERVLEIGFGNGEVLASLALSHRDKDYLGIEVHEPGVGALLQAIDKCQLSNVRIIHDDAADVVSNWLAPASIHRVNLYFPDPWPKKRHHKRRIVQHGFVGELARVLIPGGILHMATDWAPYAEHMLEVGNSSDCFTNLSETDGILPRPDDRPETKFERRGQRLGHDVADLLFRRIE
ncbi:MAG: tRNA (guanosine(46)-N7)-methyltransferase TrmB [Gammaproteobacteria bacterium]